MLAKTALPALLMMAQSVGVDVAGLKTPHPGPSAASEQPAESILKISFREIEQNQNRAIETRRYGNAQFHFSLAFSPEEPWVKVAQDSGRPQGWKFSALDQGVTASFPSGLWIVRNRG